MVSLKDVAIDTVLRNALIFRFRNWRENAMPDTSSPNVARRFLQFLCDRNIDYALVGGVALLNYVEGRNTENIDLIMGAGRWRKRRRLWWNRETGILCERITKG